MHEGCKMQCEIAVLKCPKFWRKNGGEQNLRATSLKGVRYLVDCGRPVHILMNLQARTSVLDMRQMDCLVG